MTKFTKGLLTVGLLLCAGVGGKYGYDYLNENGYFNKYDDMQTNVPKETVEGINEFLTNKYNIGFLQINYDNLDINKLEFDKIVSILNNKYKYENDVLTLIDFSKTDSFNDFVYDYNSSLNNYKVCYDVAKLNEYVYSITNQYLDAAQSTPTKCLYSIGDYFYAYNLQIDKIIFKDNIYNVYYYMYDIDRIFYQQKHNYNLNDINIKYNGIVKLSMIDGKYIFISNNIDSGTNIYNN